jgi:glycosyltransferase involved in cell wall biosynthesis
MNYFHWIAGCLLGLVWFSRVVDAARGVPKIADISRPESDRTPPRNPRVSIIVAARNEEHDIEQTLRHLLALDYENYQVIAVDDRSSDRTGEIMAGLAGSKEARSILKIISIEDLPSGWVGKTHAMWTAARQATGEWLLFTDADVQFKPDSVRRAIAYAAADHADHVVLFPRMIMNQPGEKMMTAFFQTLFVFGHRPWKVADPGTRDHMGVGAFNLIRRSVYEAIGTYQALRMEILDDMKLGKVVKNAGYAQRNVFGADLISIRWAKGAMGMVNNLTKNFYAVMSFQWPRTLRGVGVSQPLALPRCAFLPWLGAASIRNRAGVHMLHLCRDIEALRCAAVLFRPASGEHDVVCLHNAALDDSRAGPRRR